MLKKKFRVLVHGKELQFGFTLIELLVVCSVSISLMGVGATQLRRMTDKAVNKSASFQMRTITEAAKRYVSDNYEQIRQQAATGFDYEITLDTLREAGYVAASLAETNPYQQAYSVRVQEEGADLLSLVVLTKGGEAIATSNVREIANLVGGDGGYTRSERGNAGTVVGSHGGWSVNVPVAEPGHLASINYLSGKDILSASTFLHRTKEEGHPEYNRMETTLDMGYNDIEHASQLELRKTKDGSSYLRLKPDEIYLGNKSEYGTKLAPNLLEFESEHELSHLNRSHLFLSYAAKREQAYLFSGRLELRYNDVIRSQLGRDSLSIFKDGNTTRFSKLTGDTLSLTREQENATLTASSLSARGPVGNRGGYATVTTNTDGFFLDTTDEFTGGIGNLERFKTGSHLNGYSLKLPVMRAYDAQNALSGIQRLCTGEHDFGKMFWLEFGAHGANSTSLNLIVCRYHWGKYSRVQFNQVYDGTNGF